MPLPTERITLNQDENAKCRAGLNHVLNGIAEIIVNQRRPPDMLYPNVGSYFQPRKFHRDLYDTILNLRNRLASVIQQPSTKHRFNCIEYAVLAFSVRVGRNTRASEKTEKFEKKLESYRKRAKRRTVSIGNHEAYESEMVRWNEFRNWIRFNILPLRVPRVPGKRAFYREQRQGMLNQARQTIATRCSKPLAETLLQHLVTLAISEIRRGRHPGVKVRTLLAEPAKAQDFFFLHSEARSKLECHVRISDELGAEGRACRTDETRVTTAVPEDSCAKGGGSSRAACGT